MKKSIESRSKEIKGNPSQSPKRREKLQKRKENVRVRGQFVEKSLNY